MEKSYSLECLKTHKNIEENNKNKGLAREGVHDVFILKSVWKKSESGTDYIGLTYENDKRQLIYDNLFLENVLRTTEFLKAANFLSDAQPVLEKFPNLAELIDKKMIVKTVVKKIRDGKEIACVASDGYSEDAIDAAMWGPDTNTDKKEVNE